MNDNDGLLKPAPRTIIEPYEIEPDDPRVNRAGPIIAWVAIVVVIGLALYSIVWGI